MKKTLLIAAPLLVCYLILVVTIAPILRKRNTPPLGDSFDKMTTYLYAYYDKHGEIPKDLSFLPDNLEKLVNDGRSGIQWNADLRTLEYKYDQPYLFQPSPLYYCTFGLVGGGTRALGATTGPDSIRQNTPLYKSHGKLPTL